MPKTSNLIVTWNIYNFHMKLILENNWISIDSAAVITEQNNNNAINEKTIA